MAPRADEETTEIKLRLTALENGAKPNPQPQPPTEEGASMVTKLLAAAMLSMCIGLGAWNLQATHENAAELAVIRQMVVDGKEARQSAATENASAHQRLELGIKTIEAQVEGVKLRLTALEAVHAKPGVP